MTFSEADQLNTMLAQILRDKGWQPVWCTLNQGGEWTPLVGTTGGSSSFGHEGQQPEGARLAFRPPPGVKIFDVDDGYDGKHGMDTIERAEEQLGPLPGTWRVSARGDSVSGRYLYRCPEDVEFNDAVLKPFGEPEIRGGREKVYTDVEIVRTRHRFSWAPGTVHHKNQELVQVYGPDSELAAMPAVDDLPELPQGWIDYLRNPPRSASDATFTPDPNLPVTYPWWESVQDASLSSRSELCDFAYWMMVGTNNDRNRVLEEMQRVALNAVEADPWLDRDFWNMTDANTQRKVSDYLARTQDSLIAQMHSYEPSQFAIPAAPQLPAPAANGDPESWGGEEYSPTSYYEPSPVNPQPPDTGQPLQRLDPNSDDFFRLTETYKQAFARERGVYLAREDVQRFYRDELAAQWQGFTNPMKELDPPDPAMFRITGKDVPATSIIIENTVTVLFGQRGGGKTWTAATWAAQELRAGNHVVWLDFERQAQLMKRKLKTLDVKDHIAEELFHYSGGGLPPVDRLRDFVRSWAAQGRVLVVIDSFRDLLNAVVPDGNSNDGEAIAKVYSEFINPLHEGGGTLCLIDHEAKSGGGSAFGSERKESAADYVLRVEQKIAFTHRVSGFAGITVTKDRYGIIQAGETAGYLWVPGDDDKSGESIRQYPDVPEIRTWAPLSEFQEDQAQISNDIDARQAEDIIRYLGDMGARNEVVEIDQMHMVRALLSADKVKSENSRAWIAKANGKGTKAGGPVSEDKVKSVIGRLVKNGKISKKPTASPRIFGWEIPETVLLGTERPGKVSLSALTSDDHDDDNAQ